MTTIPFAVHIEDVHEEGKGSWVLALSGDGDDAKVLIVDDETKALKWYPMEKCTLVRVQTPEQPTLVVAIPAKGRPTIEVPGNGATRALRRHPAG